MVQVKVPPAGTHDCWVVPGAGDLDRQGRLASRLALVFTVSWPRAEPWVPAGGWR